MMCAKWAFLRTPEVEQHGEHRVFSGQGENPVFRITKKYVPLNR